MLVTCYPLSIAWLRVWVAQLTHPIYSPSGSCHSEVTSLLLLYRYPLSIAWLRVRFARYTFLFSLAWPWRMKSLVKHNMLKLPKLLHTAYFVYQSVDGEKNTSMFRADLFLLSCRFGILHANCSLDNVEVLCCYFKIIFQAKYNLYCKRSK